MTYARSSSAVSDGTLSSRPLLGNPSPRDSLQDHILAILAVGVVAANEGARPPHGGPFRRRRGQRRCACRCPPRHGALAMGAEVFRTLEVALYAVAFVWLDALLITARAGAGWIAVGAPVV